MCAPQLAFGRPGLVVCLCKLVCIKITAHTWGGVLRLLQHLAFVICLFSVHALTHTHTHTHMVCILANQDWHHRILLLNNHGLYNSFPWIVAALQPRIIVLRAALG